MVIPAVMLVILALVVMRALMTVVAHEDSAVPEHAIALEPTTSRNAAPATPAPELRARADDGVRSLLTEASTSSPPSPAHLDGTVRAGGSPAWLLMPAAEPEIMPEAESTADRARTSSS
jgi:hypothetical protein